MFTAILLERGDSRGHSFADWPSRPHTNMSTPSHPLTQVNLKLRPTVSRPVSFGVMTHLGPKIRFLLLSTSFRFIDVRRPLGKRTGLSFNAVHVIYIYLLFLHIGILRSQRDVKSPVPCGYLQFTILHATPIYMYVQYIQGPSLLPFSFILRSGASKLRLGSLTIFSTEER
jgi:hypothetical protein